MVNEEIKGSKKYKISECILNKMLNISQNQKYKLKKGKKYIILEPKNKEKEITNELFVDEIKYLDFVTKEAIEYLKQKYKLIDEEICALLKVKTENYKNLMQEKTKK